MNLPAKADLTMTSNFARPLRVRDFIPYVPLLFFIIWESGAFHSYFKLMTPLYIVSLASGLSLLIFFSWGRFEKARALGIPIFFLVFLLRNPVPYFFLLIIAVFFFYRNEYVLKTAFILLPLTIIEGLGLSLNIWLLLLWTFAFFLIAALYSLHESQKMEIKPVTKALLYLSFVLILISFSPNDPLAQKKDGIIAYDGFHHKLDSAFFENDTIIHSTLRYLKSIGYEVRVLDNEVSSETLGGASILILETPEKEYSAQEIDYIIDFVKSGGGLFVLGDHTNIMNCYTNLNPILNRLGLNLNFDYSMLWEPHFSSLAGLDSAEETGGATLKANRSDAQIIYALKFTTWADLGDWSAEDRAYMGNVMIEEDEDFGVLPICVAVDEDKGRVLAIANSDSMSGPNLLYNYNFIARAMNYLNYENSFIKAAWFRGILALIILAGVLRARLAAVKPLVLSLSLVLLLIMIQAALPVAAEPLEPSSMIALDVGHANAEGYGPPHQYKSIFMAIYAQHYGFIPLLVESVPDDIYKYAAYVTMGPTSPFSPEETKKLKDYVENGGTLLVFDGFHSETPADPSNEAANSLLREFEFHLNGTLLGELSYFNRTTWGYNLPYLRDTTIRAWALDHPLMKGINGTITMYSAVEVSGGDPIALCNTTPVFAVKEFGLGQVIVIGDHTIFRRFVEYEPIFSYPDPNLKKFIENLYTSLGGREQNGI